MTAPPMGLDHGARVIVQLMGVSPRDLLMGMYHQHGLSGSQNDERAAIASLMLNCLWYLAFLAKTPL